jgi:signal transduction histidine kinase
MRLSICTIVLYVYTSAICAAQDFTTINYSINEGLPSSEVYDVFEDRDGFLWFGTDNGVVRFNGFDLEKFTIDKGLTDPVVFGFYQDKKERIWFRTFSGRLCYYHDGAIHPYKFNDKLGSILPLGEVNFIYDSDREQLHFAIEALLGKIDSLGNVTFDHGNEEGVHIEIINGTPIGRSANIEEVSIRYITIDGKRFNLDDRDTKTVHRQTRILKYGDKTFFTIKKKIYQFDGEKIELVFEGRGTIISISKDHDENIWVGYLYEGAERFERGDFSKSWIPEFVRKKSVTRVLQDSEHNFWITTLENGIYHIPNFEIKNTTLETLARIRAALPLQSTILVGDEAGHVYKFNPSSNKLEEKLFFGSPVLAGFVDSRKQIWISAVNGIYVYDSLLNEINRTPVYSCVDFFEDKHGEVWGYGNHSLKNFTADGKMMSRSFFTVRYRQFLVDDSLIYFAGRIGLDIRDRTLKLKQSPAIFSNMKISDIASLTDSTLLITTLGSGFVIFNNRTWKATQFNSRNNFVADNVYSVHRTGNVFWMATEKGVATTTLSELGTPHPGFQFLTKKNGLISNKINFVIAKQNSLFAFADEGMSNIPLPIKRFGNIDPKFYIKQVRVNQQDKKLSDLAKLEHDENNIAIDFGYRSFSNANIFTRYKLQGNTKIGEKAWNNSSSNEIQFNALAPGNYNLFIEYSVDNVHWKKVAEIPAINVAVPWWLTWYFNAGLGLVVIALIFIFIRYQVSIYRNHQRKLIQSELEAIEQERTRIAKDLHDSVGTDFSAIKLMVSQVLKKHNEPKSEEIESQFQNTIQDIKSIIYGLSPPGLERYGLMAALKNYIEKLNGSISVEIHLDTFGPEVKNTRITVAIFRIIQELISNSLKHSKASAIRLHVSSFDDLISIVYEDNGKGFTWTGESKGLGLYNIESRLQSLNGTLRFDSGAFGVSYTIDIPLGIHSV